MISTASTSSPDTELAPADVTLVDVTKAFGDVEAVAGVSLQIARGSFFALLGSSGSGKTTMLRMIGGFEQPTSGRVLLGDADVTGMPPYRRDVNTVFQSYALFPHLSVSDNVGFGLRQRGIRGKEKAVRVGDALALVDLADLGHRRPSEVSGGQQQRVALARALVNHPRVLLLDEPLGALDLKLRRQMQVELKRIQREVGITFVHVTHDQEEAMTLADTVAVMRDGRIEQIGSPRAIYEQPSSAFVASFVGTCNLLPATVTGADRVRLDGGVTVSVAPELLGGRAGRVQVGVRPEHLRIGADGPNRLDALVVQSSFTGAATQLLVQTDAGELSIAVPSDHVAVSRLGAGARIEVSWDRGSGFVVEAPAPA